jgi:hypothetical protein
MMSAVTSSPDEVCASCGTAAIDDFKLKDCDDCDLVKYCSVDCQENHSEQHEEECKKRKAELRDRDLFTPPQGSHHGECPICCLPLPIHERNFFLSGCCSKLICYGCCYANQKREYEAGLEHRCPFCREPVSKSQEESNKRRIKRIKKNCPAAMHHLGKKHHNEGDYETALKYWKKAAELGNAAAHYSLSCLYYKGDGVEKDMNKAIYHSEEATIAGHPGARHNLGCIELRNNNFQRAKKHFIIAANLGHHGSLKELRGLYAKGHASKEDYATALRAYQAATEEAKSAEREEAEAYYKARGIHIY